MSILNEIAEKLMQGKAKDIKELVPKAIEQGIAPKVILEEGLLAGMSVIGEKFKNNEVYVPEVLIAARAMKGHRDPQAASRIGATSSPPAK
jgi:methanogenic corrinoid protein MtbC1